MRHPVNTARSTVLAVLVLAVSWPGCGPGSPTGGRGDLAFFLDAEETITAGLVPGAEPENVVDGWTITYERFVVAIGRIHAASRATGDTWRDDTVHVVDLVATPATGIPLVTFEDVGTGTYDDVGFETAIVTATATRHDSVPQAIFDEMVAAGCTYLVEGSLSSPAGTSTPPGGTTMPAPSIAFRLCVPAGAVFGPCSTPDGMEGVVVTSGTTTSASLTLHGDHLWFGAFPSGDELVERRAQWLANCDLDQDGTVTEAELMATDAAAVFPSPEYNLSGAPAPIVDAWDFVSAQMRTQGHLNGEGECPVT